MLRQTILAEDVALHALARVAERSVATVVKDLFFALILKARRYDGIRTSGFAVEKKVAVLRPTPILPMRSK